MSRYSPVLVSEGFLRTSCTSFGRRQVPVHLCFREVRLGLRTIPWLFLFRLHPGLEGVLPPEYWIAGDDAYICTENLIHPYVARGLPQEAQKTHLNFFIPSCACILSKRCKMDILEAIAFLIVEKFPHCLPGHEAAQLLYR